MWLILIVYQNKNIINMGTPITHFLTRKGLSPLSPIIDATRNVSGRYSNSPLQKNISREKNFVQTLTFQISPNNLAEKKRSSLQTGLNKLDKNSYIKVEITDHTKESLLINTPNKNGLMRNGLNSSTNLEILGKGSFGTVVRGNYKGIDVAVKIVKLAKNKLSPLKESNALHLNHENIIKILDIIHNYNANYGIIVMEYLTFSRHLQSILEDQHFNLSQQIVVKYALDVCKGLLHCHKNEILHLDLKPSNILVCENGLCKLCDFGNSMKLGANVQSSTYQGTVAYAAPEQLMGKHPTPKCDVYSLGILLWQMKYREIPYLEFDSAEVIIYKVVKFNYRPNSLSAFVEDQYSGIYTSCWSGNANDRPNISSVIAMLKLLT